MSTSHFQRITYIVIAIIASSLVLIFFAPLENADAGNRENLVPRWVKHVALLWSQGKISDVDFLSSMKWLVENRVLPVTDLVEEADNQTVPDSVKKIAYSWSQGNIADIEFLHGIEYLIKNGIMELNDNSVSEIAKEKIELVSIQNDTKKSVVIIPVFTAAAYSEHKFYSYYGGQCDSSCLTTTIDSKIPLGYTSSGKAVNTLQSLGYYSITDIDVDKNPNILRKYDKVVVLHNEYVTQNEFYAITAHPHVVYLYPNSLYGKISTDYARNTITLVRGHNYPDLKIRNGFDWKFDNSQLEYDKLCNNWKFDKISNGIMLNCYPENIIANNIALLKAIKDY